MQKVKLAVLLSTLVAILFYAMAVWYSSEPDPFDVVAEANSAAQGVKPAVGYTTTHTLVHVTEVLLHKSGGYLSNDVLPPFVMLDNMPAWELGALEMIRDLALSMRTSEYILDQLQKQNL